MTQTGTIDIKILLNDLYHKYPKAKENFLSMISNYEQEDLWGDEIYLQINQKGLCLKPVVSPIDMWNAINIRQIVFRDEQKVSYQEDEVYEEQIEAKTYLIYFKDKVIGTIRYRYINDAYKIERFAILKEYRGQGYGKEVLNYFTNMIWEKHNPCTIYLNGQMHAFEFYKKCGFSPVGEIFQEANIDHIKMIKE